MCNVERRDGPPQFGRAKRSGYGAGRGKARPKSHATVDFLVDDDELDDLERPRACLGLVLGLASWIVIGFVAWRLSPERNRCGSIRLLWRHR